MTIQHYANREMAVERSVERLWLFAFLLIEVVLLCEVVLLARILPYLGNPLYVERRLGGPDEYVHISVVEYLARHGRWPRWDSPELLRSGFGVSYSTTASAIYWFFALCLRATGYVRSGPIVCFVLLLSFLFWLFRRSRHAGLFGLAALVPQAVFVFGYVNSDVQTVLVAIATGFASATFILRPGGSQAFALFVAAAVSLTARQHAWPITLATTAYAITQRPTPLATLHARTLILGAATFLAIASWWPATSLIANDGDPIGFVANQRSIERFSLIAKPSALGWEGLPIRSFLHGTGASFYGLWGLMSVKLPLWIYAVAAASLAGVVAVIGPLLGRHRSLIAFLFGLNFALSLVYSVYYDYQPQGRYLFPAYFTAVGFTAALLAQPSASETLRRNNREKLFFSAVWLLIGTNLIGSLCLLFRCWLLQLP